MAECGFGRSALLSAIIRTEKRYHVGYSIAYAALGGRITACGSCGVGVDPCVEHSITCRCTGNWYTYIHHLLATCVSDLCRSSVYPHTSYSNAQRVIVHIVAIVGSRKYARSGNYGGERTPYASFSVEEREESFTANPLCLGKLKTHTVSLDTLRCCFMFTDVSRP
jgi:hypothetical protein